jgi:hypothetical protein
MCQTESLSSAERTGCVMPQIENIYCENGLKKFKLKSTDDLFKVHGIDFKNVQGYDMLDNFNKVLYSRFILNFYNTTEPDSRASLIPKAVYHVEVRNYLVKTNPDQVYYTVAGNIVEVIDKHGTRTVLKKWLQDKFKNHEITQSKGKKYLRFEYEHEGCNEWLYVINGIEWF